jgi:hypothetical protein
MESLKITACAALILVSISSGAAQPVKNSHFSSHSSQTHHYQSINAPNSRGLPRSTVAGGSLVSATGRSTGSQSELNRLEQQSRNQLQAESRHGVRPISTPSHSVHTIAPSRGSSINFSYQGPHAQTTRSSSSSTRRR